MKKEIFHTIYVPGGNDTSFVYGTNFTQEERKKINDKIMEENINVEQVGFLGEKSAPELIMAGGEFCGNATRSAVYYYLNGKDGEMTLKVNEKDYIEAGVKNGLAWCQIPLNTSKEICKKLEPGIYKVQMEGMTTIVLSEKNSTEFLKVSEDKKEEMLKATAMQFIKKYKLEDCEAVGVMFLEKEDNLLKINPVVWVNAIDTLFYETACGSGTTATAIVESFIKGHSISIDVLQPSGYVIIADITYNEGIVEKAVISGNVMSDNIKRKLIIE